MLQANPVMASNLPAAEFRGGNLGAWDSETKYQPEKNPGISGKIVGHLRRTSLLP